MEYEKVEQKIQYFLPIICSIALFGVHQFMVVPTNPINIFNFTGILEQIFLRCVNLLSLLGATILLGIQLIMVGNTVRNKTFRK